MEEQRKKIQKKMAKHILQNKNKKELVTSILNPILLYIGRWKFQGINEKDEMVVKLNFVNKQICYEVLWNGCRQKIEIEWSHIMGIRASLNHKEPGILEVELSQPPKLYEKLDDNKGGDRGHNKWVVRMDFTQGQAPICRRHLIMFPPGMLDSHFVRLISYDKHLFELSRNPYPTINIPYFHNQQPNNVYQSNQFTMTTSNNQILQLPPHLPQPLSTIIPQASSGVGLASNFGTVTVNNNFNPDVEFSNWISVLDEVANTTNGSLWNNDNDNDWSINGGLLRMSNNGYNNSSNFTNMPTIMYSDSDGSWNDFEAMMNNNNNNPTNGSSLHYSVQPSYNGYNFSNWPTDEYGVWKPPP